MALNSNNDVSEKTHKNEQPTLSQILIKEEKRENGIILADSDGSECSGYEFDMQCACCKQFTEELLNCISCHRFYHNDCHIPPADNVLQAKNPLTTSWKCTLCQDLIVPCTALPLKHIRRSFDIGFAETKVIERILMELYCQNDDSELYQDRLDREIYPMYYENIINPISLNDIKQRYISGAYKSLVDVLKDIKTVFTNGKLYFCLTDPYYISANELHMSLIKMMNRWLPEFDQRLLE